ncbi:rhodanese-like domain-containing protein [Corynebacterium aquilae]|uniref:rhodanese-like domain-containing protein n=1 Tax=Corynebacterium aquilae TaxID=203263 RepID=UPI000951195B|nr:rhodanese-like domain-containing protein [Corynebacterium aquilae]
MATTVLRTLTVGATSLALATCLQACSTNTETTAPTTTAASDTTAGTHAEKPIVIDVRTPGEFADGHLEGARNIDFNGANFTSEIETLDRDASYVLYCRSGNRAGQALKKMEDMGFADVSNAGSVKQASQQLDIPVVTGTN